MLIKDVELGSFKCDYAGISRKKATKDAPWTLNLGLNFTGKVYFDINILGRKVEGVMADLEQFAAFFHGELASNNLDKPDFHMNTLQTSIQEIGLIGYLLPSPTEYYLPGLINTNGNPFFIDLINKAIRKYLGHDSDSKGIMPSSLANLRSQQIKSLAREMPVDLNTPLKKTYSTWMSMPAVQNKPLCRLKIPGTHDSAAYLLERVVSQMLPPDVQFLRDLSPETAPEDHDLFQKPYYLGEKTYKYVLEEVNRSGQAHHESKTIYQQLCDGVRIFDLRIYRDDREDGKVYTHHSLRGPLLSDIFVQISGFIKQFPDAAELLIFELSHANFDDGWKKWEKPIREIVRSIENIIGTPNLYMLPDYKPGGERYDFQMLKDTKVSEISQGRTKVIFANTEGFRFPDLVIDILEGDKFWPKPDERQPPLGNLYGHWFTTPPSTAEVVNNILRNADDPAHPHNILQDMARVANQNVAKVLKEGADVYSRFMMDWYTEPKSQPPLPLIIEAIF